MMQRKGENCYSQFYSTDSSDIMYVNEKYQHFFGVVENGGLTCIAISVCVGQ